MDIAIGLPNTVPGVGGPKLVAWAQRAEAEGFSSLGTIGRTVWSGHEELIALAAAAGVTERIRLATTVMISPTREPVLLAKQAATLDAISGGRFSLGVGTGWRDDDFRATGIDFRERGRILDRQLELLRRIWAGEPPAPGLDAVGPSPARSGGPELIVGGTAPAALARAGHFGDAFQSPPFPPEEVERLFGAVLDARKAAGRGGRPRLLGAGYFALGEAAEQGADYMARYYAVGGPEFVETMTSALLRTPDDVRRVIEGYRSIGMDELFLWPAVADTAQVETLARAVR